MTKSPTSLMPGYDERAARFMARQAKGTLVKGSAQSAKQKEGGMKPKKEMKKEEVELDEGEQMDEARRGDRFHIKMPSGKPANLSSHATLDSAKKERDEKYPEADIHQLGPRGSVKKIHKARAAFGPSPADRLSIRSDKGVAEGIELDERTLTEPEKKKKEDYVLSMKKKMPGFKERYGERAKSVLYATATKMAKKD
jgi:hypothetical protein